MAVIAVIADTHFGVSNSNGMFLRYQDRYFKGLIEDLTRKGVTDLFHAGDLYDVRKNINFKTLRETAAFFRERMISAPFNVHIVVGNHDSYNKNSLKINAPKELLDWTDFKIYDDPTEIAIDGTKILLMPWMCNDNVEKSHYMLDQTYADVCIGHFDISGFGMSKEVINKVGMPRSIFQKFKKVFSGHFHLPSNQDNILYVGSPYQLTWSDYGDIKRVALYDTKTDELSYIENHDSIFEKVYYVPGIEPEDKYHDKIVKVYGSNDSNAYEFDKFVRKIEEQIPYSLSVIETTGTSSNEVLDLNITKDTMSFLVDFIDTMEIKSTEKDEIKTLMLKLYHKAQELN